MRKRRLLLFLLPLVSLLLFYCTDDISKNADQDGNVRIEFSNCTACYECIDLFDCPQNAIYIDETHGTAAIDPDKCVQCMRCINDFHCQYNAFTFSEDAVSPAPITDFSAISDSIGTLDIRFTATGDDSTSGIAWRYELDIETSGGEPVDVDFTPGLPKLAGLQESWHLSGLTADQTVQVSVRAYDECSHYTQTDAVTVTISSSTPDTTPPAAIDNLTALSDEDYITLAWSAPSDNVALDRYEIRYASSAITDENWLQATIVENDLVPQQAGSCESFQVTGLSDQNIHFFAVRAYDTSENIAAISNNVTGAFTPDVIAPAQITTLTTDGSGLETVELRWTAVGDDGTVGCAESYLVRYSTNVITPQNWQQATIFENQIDPQVSGNTETLTVDGLESGTVYYFAVKAIDNAGNQSQLSNVLETQTEEVADHTAPAAIEDLVVGSTSNTTALIRWTAPGDDGDEGTASSYIVKVYTEEITESNWNEINAIDTMIEPQPAGSQESLVVTNLQPNTEYWFGIKALDEMQNVSDLSNVAQGQTESEEDTVAPDAITDLSASAQDSAINLSWTATGDDGSTGTASYYEIRTSLDPITDDNWQEAMLLTNLPVPQESGTQQSYSFTSPEPNTLYYFAIRAFDETPNGSALSNVVSAEIVDDIAPSAINDLQATAGTADIDLQWTAPGDDEDTGTAASYEIRMYEQEITIDNWQQATLLDNPPEPEDAGTTQQYTVYSPTQDQIWFFAIRATDDAGNIAAVSNNAESGIFDTTAPADITDLAAEQSGEDALLTWTAPGDDGFSGIAESYEIRYAATVIDETSWNSATILPDPPDPQTAGTQQQYAVTGLSTDVQYFFGIKTTDDADNQSDLSNIADVTLGDDTVAPGVVTNLTVSTTYVNMSTIRIQWTAPGDDGSTGTADHYEIRYSSSPITDANWSSATLFDSPPDPSSAGTQQTCNVSGLDEGELYYFAIRAYDEIGNESDCSNSPAGKIVYKISTTQCRDCNHCITRCDQNAIYDAGSYKAINPDLCIACGDCDPYCPYNAISPGVVAYND